MSQNLTSTQNRQTAYFTTIDLNYTDSQLQFHDETAKNCNFIIID